MSFSEIVSAVHGEVVLKGEYPGFNAVNTDTRKIEKKDIFVALKGENFNGNEYIKAASEKGASICIVDEILYKDEEIKKNTTIIKVKNTKQALLDLAEAYREKLNLKVVAITGSAGKTSTKDLVAAALSGKYKVFKTAGNFNNQIGLPLMIFKLDNSYDIAVLEMGMNNLNEIHTMAKAARPDISLITNVGTAHIGNLGSRENILKAKMEITDFFNAKNILIINGDNDMLGTVKDKQYSIVKCGIDCEADFKAISIKLGENCVDFEVAEKDSSTKENIHLDMPGKHTILNAMLAVTCGRIMNMNYEEIRQGLKNLQATSMRMDIIEGNKFTIINDCYNANPDSMKAAIDVLKDSRGKRKLAVLGTMGELGEVAFASHKQIGEYAAQNNIDLLITIGDYNKAYEEGFKAVDNGQLNKYKAFENYDDAVDFLIKEYLQKEDTVLVKASRAAKFETIVEKLKKSNS